MEAGLREQDTGFAWVYTLVFVFVLVVLHFILFPIINSYVVPSLIDASADAAEVSTNINRIVLYWRIATYGFFISALLYSLLSVFRRERQDYNI